MCDCALNTSGDFGYVACGVRGLYRCANCNFCKDTIHSWHVLLCHENTASKHSVLAGMHALHELIEQLHADEQQLVLANPSRKVQAQLKRVKLLNEIGPENVFVRTTDAVKFCQHKVRQMMAKKISAKDLEEGVAMIRRSDSIHSADGKTSVGQGPEKVSAV